MLRSIVSSIEFEKFRRNWSENELNETLFTKAFQVVSHFNYEICELRRRPGKLSERLPMGRRSGSRCIEFIIRPNFLTSNSC
ncbi:hypothetical protein [Leptospira noguchii]|uniref:hypothetical protein n=1 Tax=Leptospira noguchii TaxID=28182 RepID=UPI001FB8495D|nr:hypothetical protein [Leptospira noguchii]UOG48803.1 hypothetical protein MAL00_00230 [Leptospira noguchii]